MKSTKALSAFSLLAILFCFNVNNSQAQLPEADTLKTEKGNIIIQPVFHATMVLKFGDKTIYVDPYNGAKGFAKQTVPELILLTDIHQDHMDVSTLEAINTSKAKFIVPLEVANSLPAIYKNKITVLENGKSIDWEGISITAVAMYNLPEEENAMHTKGRGNGYVLTFGGKSIYISGDTEDIPEMRSLKNIDVAFVCMNQPYTMTVEQAAGAVLEFQPKIVYPYHYRNKEGFSDVKEFKKIISKDNSKIDVRLRNWYLN